MPENKEQYIKMLHEVYLEKLQHDTGGHEEAIKNVRYCIALSHLFSAGLLKRKSLSKLFNVTLSHLSEHHTSI